MKSLQPLQRRSVVDEALETLRARILHGAWQPGEKLPTEQALTEALGVSRSTVREALNRLASTGLIEAPHSGSKRVLDWRDHAGLEVLAALVVSPTGQVALPVVRSVTEMRSALAPDMARLAAEQRSDEQAAQLTALAADLDPAADLDALLLATLEWWTLLVHASGNLAYRLAYNTLRTTYMEGRPLLREIIAEELRAVSLYQTISIAVAAQDAPRAEALCRELVALGAQALFAAIDAFPGD